MKANYRVPYPFLDLKQRNKHKIKHEVKDNNLYIHIDSIDNYGISSQFINDIDYGIELQCSGTMYRKYYSVDISKLPYTLKISLEDIVRDVSLKMIALANNDIEDYINDDNHLTSFIEKGSALAILFDKPIIIEDYGGDYGGLVKATRSDKSYIDYDLSNDYLLIKIPDNQFDYFESLINDKENLPIIFSSIVKPCFIHACHFINEGNDDKLWISVFKEKADNHNSEDFLSMDDIPQFVEELLGLCTSKAIEKLSNQMNQDEDDSI